METNIFVLRILLIMTITELIIIVIITKALIAKIMIIAIMVTITPIIITIIMAVAMMIYRRKNMNMDRKKFWAKHKIGQVNKNGNTIKCRRYYMKMLKTSPKEKKKDI